ncbi:hypothetical protein NQ315_006572 [Exocentrus adspersus]|uniref:Uncharacterized protein n=1 Tax=Exocentrus adspersus TaxID=1586481 RepID=A0AAV8VGM2_9CUCU|nr:hypothetical protein NQ315_006572 [Exocentrus adspersus]
MADNGDRRRDETHEERPGNLTNVKKNETFIGVEFDDTDGGGVGLINSKWITPRKKEAWWPPYKESVAFERALKRGETPDESTWTLCKVVRSFFEEDDFIKAKKKLKRTEAESDVQSEEESQSLGKRRRYKMRDMLCVYAQEDFNGRRAHRRYLQTYPNRRQPDFKIFKRIYDRLGETGSFRPKRDILGRPKRITVEQEEEILLRVAEDPQISTRRLKTLTGVSQTGVLKVLHKERLHPYYFTPVQFSNFCRIRHNEDPTFLDRILFTDEATFTRRGIFNYRNKHVWDTENPHAITARHFQHEFKDLMSYLLI